MFGKAREEVRYRLDMDLLMDVPRLREDAPAGRREPSVPAKRYVQGLCPYCEVPYRICDELADHKIRCRQCRGVFLTDEYASAVRPPNWPDDDDQPKDARGR